MNIKTANRLYEFRKKHNLSQEELAAKIGVSRQAVSKWERAEASPDTDNLILLAEIYGVTLDELLTEQKEDAKEETSDEASAAKEKSGDENNEYTANEDVSYRQADSVSFKNGIHINAKNGDKVNIGFSGIHVDDHKGDSVHIGPGGIFVKEKEKQRVYTDEDGNVHYDENMEGHIFNKGNEKKKSMWYHFPYPVLAVIAFLVWGFLGGWAVSWVVFLTIPLYYTLIDAVVKRNPKHFAYPVLVVIAYLLLGLYMGLWHPMWVLFLTIPIYYFLAEFIGKMIRRNK